MPREAAQDVKRILAGIVQEAGGAWAGKTRLFKAYYWAYRYYWDHFRGALTRHHMFVKMDRGPGVDGHRDLIAEMQAEGLLRVQVGLWGIDAQQSAMQEIAFSSARPIELTDEERTAIQAGISRVGQQTAHEASHESHQESRTWNRAQMGAPLPVCLDTLTEEEFTRREGLIDSATAELDELFR